MRRPLSQLPPGTRFLQPDLQIIGTLLTVTDSAAKVELERPMQAVEFTDPESGERRSFVASRSKTTTWAPSVSVLTIALPDPETESEIEMAKKAAAKKPRVKTTKAERELKKRQKAAAKAAEPKPAAKKRGRPAKAPAEPKPAAEPKARRTPKPPAEPKAKKVSALDAAHAVLVAAKAPLTCQQMIDEMAAKKLWVSPGGKTPAATLYAAICREIEKKGTEARFEKVERGTFKAA